ncbi:radical SAM protein [Candidatus Bathyarchaeota archaeon]|nr:radical SAM protein [Candidatus Bathyarchaeota archaeon]
MRSGGLPEKIRVSIGSAIALGLTRGTVDVLPTTVYMLTYKHGKCSANCAFCPQSKTSGGRADMLSRVVWPAFSTEEVVKRLAKTYLEGKVLRSCIQALNYPHVQEDLMSIAQKIRFLCDIPISVSCQPLTRETMKKLAEAGINRVGIALDAATESLFDKTKGINVGGPYKWQDHLRALKEAVEIFGKNNVSTHLIVGLGEQEEEFVKTLQDCVDMGVYPALFAFTPISGTVMETHLPPSVDRYRRLQLAQYLITHGLTRYENMKFEKGCLIDFGPEKEDVKKIIGTGEPFRTSGCPGCNRPYYNERPKGPIYNFPRKLTEDEVKSIEKDLCI